MLATTSARVYTVSWPAWQQIAILHASLQPKHVSAEAIVFSARIGWQAHRHVAEEEHNQSPQALWITVAKGMDRLGVGQDRYQDKQFGNMQGLRPRW